MSNEAPLPKGWRGGGCSGFRMGAKTKTPINPRGKNVFIHQNLWSYHESSYCFKYPQNSSYPDPEIYFPNFLTQKNPGIKNFKPPQNQPRPQGFSHFLREKPWGRGCPKTPSIIPIIWNPEYPPPYLEPPMWVWNQDRPLGRELRLLPQNCYMCQACETGPTVYRPYLWRRLERGSQWGGGFYGYRLKFWFFYGYRLIFFSYG